MDCSVGGFFLRVGEWGELKGARWRWFFFSFFLSFPCRRKRRGWVLMLRRDSGRDHSCNLWLAFSWCLVWLWLGLCLGLWLELELELDEEASMIGFEVFTCLLSLLACLACLLACFSNLWTGGSVS